MDTIIWIIGVGLPIAVLIYLFGWLVGFNVSCQMTNWGTGFDDGWKAYEELMEETRRTDHGLDKPESGD